MTLEKDRNGGTLDEGGDGEVQLLEALLQERRKRKVGEEFVVLRRRRRSDGFALERKSSLVLRNALRKAEGIILQALQRQGRRRRRRLGHRGEVLGASDDEIVGAKTPKLRRSSDCDEEDHFFLCEDPSSHLCFSF